MAANLIKPKDVKFPWIRRELIFKSTLKKGAKNQAVRFVQECLVFSGQRISVDRDFGFATETAVKDFQSKNKLNVSGVVDRNTFQHLIAPFLRVLTPIQSNVPLNELVVAYAEKHLAENPREVGGKNAGPWVRLYMNGNDGPEWLWCAGFVTFVIRQAATYHGLKVPAAVRTTFSCDVLAERAKNDGRFVSERRVKGANKPSQVLPPGSVFLVRRTNNDWTHTGFVTQAARDVIRTIEGNTNDEGSREGYEVCARTRAYKKKDFVVY